MSNVNPDLSGLDTAISNLSNEVDAALAAFASLEAKANKAGIDVSKEVSTITTLHDKLLAAVSTAVGQTSVPPIPGPGGLPPTTPVTGTAGNTFPPGTPIPPDTSPNP